MKTLDQYMKLMVEPKKPKKEYVPLTRYERDNRLYVGYAFHNLCEFEGIFKLIRFVAVLIAIVLWTLINSIFWFISLPIGIIYELVSLAKSKNSKELVHALKNFKWAFYPFEVISKH